MYTHIFFDADDTLLDFKKGQLLSFKTVLEGYDIPFSDDLYITYSKINYDLWQQLEQGAITRAELQSKRFSSFFASIGQSISGDEAELAYKQYLGEQSCLMPFAEEVCRELSRKYTLTIVTNGISEIQNRRFAACAILPYLTNIVISDDIGISKPDKRFFKHALAVSQCKDPSEVLLVGDSLAADIKGANNTGLDACWYNPEGVSLPDSYRVKYIISDLRELLDIL